jgi:hypothetical protein
MLEKLATHDVQDVSALFSLAYKCAKAMEGHTWHSLATQAAKGEGKPSVGAQAQGGATATRRTRRRGGEQGKVQRGRETNTEAYRWRRYLRRAAARGSFGKVSSFPLLSLHKGDLLSNS